MTRLLTAECDQAPSFKILIIEDQSTICELYSAALRSTNHPYDIQLTHSGEDGVEAALKDRPDLVILDLSLPGISGIEVAEKLKLAGILPKIPLIVASGEAQEVTERIQASSYLSKPFPITKLVGAVQDALTAALV
jgi:CheY-like chemotaxis protein